MEKVPKMFSSIQSIVHEWKKNSNISIKNFNKFRKVFTKKNDFGTIRIGKAKEREKV